MPFWDGACRLQIPPWEFLSLSTSKVALVVKNVLANVGDMREMGSIPGLGRSPGGGHGNPLQYSCLENPMDGGDWWASLWGRKESDMTKVT